MCSVSWTTRDAKRSSDQLSALRLIDGRSLIKASAGPKRVRTLLEPMRTNFLHVYVGHKHIPLSISELRVVIS